MRWLPEGKRAAVCFSVDDVHPADVAFEALGHVRALQEDHPQLRATFFTTPDWRTIEPRPISGWKRRVPYLRDRMFLVPVHPAGTFRLDRHPAFCDFLREWEGVEVAVHGLHHVRTGRAPIHEFDGCSFDRCVQILRSALAMFHDAGLPVVRGLAPPGWNASAELRAAAEALGFSFLASARDLDTPIEPGAKTCGSGMHQVSLIAPQRLGKLLHISTNFQATSTIDRAVAIIESGGLLAIKAHLLAESGSYRALDGLTPAYRAHLHEVFSVIEERFGNDVWWASMSELAESASC